MVEKVSKVGQKSDIFENFKELKVLLWTILTSIRGTIQHLNTNNF